MHVLLSLVGIVSGFVVVFGLRTARRLDGWTALFLASTLATSVSGFGFPSHRLLPSHIIGTISLVVLGRCDHFAIRASPGRRQSLAASAERRTQSDA
jgi:hypothetical protein